MTTPMTPATDVDEEYFTSYFDLAVHKLMLDDKPRTEAYREAIEANREAFKDKVVMGKLRAQLLVQNLA